MFVNKKLPVKELIKQELTGTDYSIYFRENYIDDLSLVYGKIRATNDISKKLDLGEDPQKHPHYEFYSTFAANVI